jgi:putative nucleotidyltransferase with HDIG domain
VISLFHDIGKMVKPEYYTENQQSEESKHSKLNPRMSSLVILNHVKEGVDMALKHKLRKIIRDGIEQHHGTDLIFYFYQQALEEGRTKGVTVDEHDYRYPGPLPKEKEVVILSLADSCEAASRSLQKPTPAKIDALVWEIFRKRIRNGQLDGANLTFGELKRVRKSFVTTLTTMMHGRIAYPKDETEEEDEGDLFAAAKQKGLPPAAKKA